MTKAAESSQQNGSDRLQWIQSLQETIESSSNLNQYRMAEAPQSKWTRQSRQESQSKVDEGLHNFDRLKRVPDYDTPLGQSAPSLIPKAAPRSEIIELNNMRNRSAQHTTPDAVVRIPPNFDPTKPIHVLVYNHGFYDNVRSSFRGANLDEAMESAPPNTILILPEWQVNAGKASSAQGDFSDKNLFQGMVEEIFEKVPALQKNTTKDIDSIDIISHSAGYGPTESVLYANDIASKVKSVSLLDSLYDSAGFDRWIKNNIKDLSSGEKQFNNFYYGTRKYSEALAGRIKKMLTDAKLPTNSIFEDNKNGQALMDPAVLANRSLVSKYTNAKVNKLDPHMSTPNIYIPIIETSISKRRPTSP